MATYSRPGVFIQEVELPQAIELAEGGAAIGAFVGSLQKGPTSAPVLVNSWSEFTKTFGSLNDAYPTTWAAYNFFSNGGRQLYVKRITGAGASASSVTLTDRANTPQDTLTLTAKSFGAWGNDLAVSVSAAGVEGRFNLTIYGAPTILGNATSNILESFTDLSMDSTDPRYAIAAINADSSYVTATDEASPTSAPDNLPDLGGPSALAGGLNGAQPALNDYIAGLSSLDPIRSPLVINIPAAAYVYTTSGTGTERTLSLNISAAAVAYAETRGDAFAVVDCPQGLTVAEAKTYAADLKSAFAADSDGGVAAMYYPWVQIPDALKASRAALRNQAPGAIMVGQYLANDASRGVFKTPAGFTQRVALAVNTQKQLTNNELDTLNTGTNPINAIRQVPGAGIIVMGGRTLNNTTNDRYINIRRSLIYIKKELEDRSAFAVFENNDSILWNRISTALTTFLRGYWQSGGLRGATPQQAFYVKIDNTTTTFADIQAGRVNIEVGVALQYPAEFIVIKLGQITGNATA